MEVWAYTKIVWNLEFALRYLALALSLCYLVFGIWNLTHGLWNLVIFAAHYGNRKRNSS
jgi:hypothetical protein